MIHILQFEGTDKYFFCLYQNKNESEDKKYYLLFSNIETISFNSTLDENIFGQHICTSCSSTIVFELMKKLKNNSIFTTIEVDSVEEYEKIVKVVKLLL